MLKVVDYDISKKTKILSNITFFIANFRWNCVFTGL